MDFKHKISYFLFFSLFFNLLFSQNSVEFSYEKLSLKYIDNLINETEYDTALNFLNEYLKENPDDFDKVERRIKKIMKAKNEYAFLAEKLIDMINSGNSTDKEIYEITKKLEQFEKKPSNRNLQFIADLKNYAEFTYFRKQFNDIQIAATDFSQKNDCVNAIKTITSGFWLYKDNFYDLWKDDLEVISQTDTVVNSLNENLLPFLENDFINSLQKSVNSFINSVNSKKIEDSLSEFEKAKKMFIQFEEYRKKILIAGRNLQNHQENMQKKDASLTDSSYLSFLTGFLYGTENIEHSGIINFLNNQFDYFTKQMNDCVFAMVQNHYKNFLNSITSINYQNIEKYTMLQIQVLDLYDLTINTEFQPIENPLEDYYIPLQYIVKLSQNSVNLSKLNSLVNLQKTQKDNLLLNFSKNQKNENLIKPMFDFLQEHQSLYFDLPNQNITNLQFFNENASSNLNYWIELEQIYQSIFTSINNSSSEIVQSLWEQIAKFYQEKSFNMYKIIKDFNECAKNYETGFFTKIPESIYLEINNDITKSIFYEKTFDLDKELDFGINYSYPNLTLKIIEYNNNEIEKSVKQIDNDLQIIEEYFQNSLYKNELIDLVENTKNYILQQKQNILELKQNALLIAESSQTKIINSTLAKNEGDLLFEQGENALKNENFELARRKIQEALSKYDESLNNQNDEEMRQIWDEKLQLIGLQIAQKENEVVVKDVRNLKNRAKDAYFNGRFDDAEKLLNEAQIRWAVTNIEQDEEIVNLLNFVTTAISMKTGREIPPSAPQYPEMSQIINIANQYFDEGMILYEKGEKENASISFEKSLENIQKIQYLYPLNQQASILTLKINKMQDTQKFTEEFSQKIKNAELMCQSQATRQEGYANLLDYAQIEPNFKGLRDLIYQVEIDIGIRRKPVQNNDESQARRLITDAKNEFENAGNNTKKLENALEKINKALNISPDNENAISLKDKIMTKIGGNTATVLSTEDERLYQLAIRRLQSNNIVGAKAIVEKLLQNERNSYSQKIMDLKNKIEARS